MATQKRFIAKNGLDNNSNSIINVADPTNAQDVATKAFVLANASASGVSSVNTRTGAVTLTSSDVGLGNVSNTAQVTSVTGTSPVISSGGTTPAISMAAATASVNGYMTSTYATKLDGISAGATTNTGTVTSVAALTLGTTGTDVSSTVATGTTTPVITLNIPTASATNRGALSSTDWGIFNGKQAAGAYLTSAVTSVGGTGTVSGLTLTGTVTSTGSLTLGGTLALGSLNTLGTAAGLSATLIVGSGGTGVTTLTGIPYGNGTSAFTVATAAQLVTAIGASTTLVAGSMSAADKTKLDAISGTNTGDQVIPVASSTTPAAVGTGTVGVGTTWARADHVHGGVASFAGGTTGLTPAAATTGAVTLAGTLAVANGGTGAITAAAALTALGAYPATNPSGYTANIGTVTSVAALTLGTTGTDVSSSIATGTTTPVITLQIPTASAANRGALSAADWTTFNNKQPSGAYLTTESDTLASVTGRAATTATASTFSGGLTVSGTTALTLSNATSNIITSGTDVNTFIQTRDSSAANTGAISIRTGDSTFLTGYAGSVSIYAGSSTTVSGSTVSLKGGNVTSATSTGGFVLITGGNALTTATTAGTGGAVQITGGYAYAASGIKVGGSVYLDGGLPFNAGTNTAGQVYIGTASSGINTATTGTSAITIGVSAITTTVNGTVKLPNVGTSGFVKLGAGGQLSADTTVYTSNTGTVTGVTATSPVASSGGTAPVISMAAATTSDSGYLSSTDWNTFNNKQPSGSYLTSAVTTFSAGTTGLTPSTATSGAVTLAGTLAIANGGTGAITAAAALTALGAYPATNPSGYTAGGITLASSITGYVAGANTALAATDTVNAALGKLQGQVTARGVGTVTSVATSGNVSGITLTGGTITGSGTITLGGSIGTLNQNTTGSSGSCTGNAATATTLIGDQTNWASYRTSAVANMLSWKNFGNGHVIFDASNSTSPAGSAVNSTNAATAWTASYPTLMGWNGGSTYGVRVDSARISDSTSGSSASCSGNAATATTAGALQGLTSGANGSIYTDVNWAMLLQGFTNGGSFGWRPTNAVSIAFSCTNTGNLNAVGTISGTNITTGGNVTGSSASCTGNAATATAAASVSSTNAQMNGTDGWWRSTGNAGWYSTTHAVGIYATEAGNVRTYNGANFITAGISATTGSFSGSLSGNGNIFINNGSPTLYFQDTDQMCAMLHNNSNLFHILRGGINTTTWTTVNGHWPMVVNLSNNDVSCGGNISAVSNITAYASDKRLKENIVEIPNAIEKIKKIRGVTFDWNDVSESNGFRPQQKYNDIGVIAQEIEEVLPQVVTLAPFDRWRPDPNKDYSDEELAEKMDTSKSGENYKTVQYDRIVPLLIQAIKEQQVQIDELKELISKGK
jgi:hypothetical protein